MCFVFRDIEHQSQAFKFIIGILWLDGFKYIEWLVSIRQLKFSIGSVPITTNKRTLSVNICP